MSCTPGIFIFSRRSRRNPYADRGLAEFARVAAELEAKRKKLFVELGTQLSVVRFASGSDHRKWVPIIICPSLSAEEIRTLRRAATNLISEDGGAHIQKPIATTNGEKGNLTDCATLSTQNANPSMESRGMNSMVGGFGQLVSAAEKLLWMAAFGLSIVADIVGNILRLKPHPVMPSKRRPNSSKAQKHNRSATVMASSSLAPSLPQQETTPSSIQAPEKIRVKSPPHPLHVKASKAHKKEEITGYFTAPSTPTQSKQLKRPYRTSVSLPKTCEQRGIGKEKQLCTMVSLPKTIQMQGQDPHTSSSSGSEKTGSGREEKAEKWGQALAGAGLALGLSGLVMGYVPAIVSVVCWWYLLPNLRKAVGEGKPIVKSHHHHDRA